MKAGFWTFSSSSYFAYKEPPFQKVNFTPLSLLAFLWFSLWACFTNFSSDSFLVDQIDQMAKNPWTGLTG